MPARRLPAANQRSLLAEYASLRYVCPEGIYVAPSPGDASLWEGVLFVRDGQYASAVLRFEISFPYDYPHSPPLLSLVTDVFHPLVTPLTTYSYSTGLSDSATASATDEKRLPPGSFSLKHGFGDWLHGQQALSPTRRPTQEQGIIDVLEYFRHAFNSESFLDELTADGASNIGAWHAWQAYRAKTRQTSSDSKGTAGSTATSDMPASPGLRSAGVGRRPGEWNWDGVWEDRVRKGVRNSLSEAALFGPASTNNELIRFSGLDWDEVKPNAPWLHQQSTNV